MTPALATIFVARMLTHDLFAVANLLVDDRSQELVDICLEMSGRVNLRENSNPSSTESDSLLKPRKNGDLKKSSYIKFLKLDKVGKRTEN